MTTYVALLRAVNVGGTGKLPMSDLVAICERIGFLRTRTYIASGNAVFDCPLAEKHVKRRLEAELESYAKKPVGVIVRTVAQMAAVLAANPFPKAVPNRTVAIFLDKPPSPAMLRGMTGVKSEKARLGVREIYVSYPDGIGVSKLRIPGAEAGTARNMNTIAKLVQIAAADQAKARLKG